MSRFTARWAVDVFLLMVSAALTLRLAAHSVWWTAEDGYYYYKIAQNFVGGLGSTFDGVNATNGYQPLWLAVLLPLASISRSPEQLLELGIAAQGLFLGITLLLLDRTLRLFCVPSAAFLGAVTWLALALRDSFQGLEFSLACCCLALVALFFAREMGGRRPACPPSDLNLGVASALAFLARLDAFALGVLLIVPTAFAIRSAPHRVARLVLPLALTAALYAFANVLAFGLPVPISGVVRAGWSAEQLAASPLEHTSGDLAARLANLFWPLGNAGPLLQLSLALGTVGAVATFLLAYRSRARRADVLFLLPLTLYSLVIYGFYGLYFFGSLSTPPRYYAIQSLLAAFVAGLAADALIRRFSAARLVRLVPAAAALIPLLVVAGTVVSLETVEERGERYDPLRAGALWARVNLPPGVVLGAWNAGTLGFLSERRTVNLDGVVNTLDYTRQGRADLCAYFRAQRIEYLVDVFDGDHALSVVSPYPAYAHCEDDLVPIWSDTRPSLPWRLQVYRITSP